MCSLFPVLWALKSSRLLPILAGVVETSLITVPAELQPSPRTSLDGETERLLAPWSAVPPEIVALSRALRSDPLDLKGLTKAAQGLPRLTERMLRLSNTSLFHLEQPVSTMAQAAMSIRCDVLQTLLMTCHLIDRLAGELPAPERRAFWRHALLVGTFSQRLAEWTGLAEPELAYFAGLLHDVGWIALIGEPGFANACGGPEMEMPPNELVARREAEPRHRELGAALGRLWALPEAIVEAIEFHDKPERAVNFPGLASIVSAADACARALIAPEATPSSLHAAGFRDHSAEMVLQGLDSQVRVRLAEVFAAEFEHVESRLNGDFMGAGFFPRPTDRGAA